MNTSPVSGQNNLPYTSQSGAAGKTAGTGDYEELLKKVRASWGKTAGGVDLSAREGAAPSSSGKPSDDPLAEIGEILSDRLEQFMAEREERDEEKKLDELLGIKDPNENFWEARARREEEFQTLREEETRKERILERLRSGEPVSAAELLLTL